MIEICEIFTVGGLPIHDSVRKVSRTLSSSMKLQYRRGCSNWVYLGFLRGPYWSNYGNLLDSAAECPCRVPAPGRWYGGFHWFDLWVCHCAFHWHRVHCFGHCVRLVWRVPGYRSFQLPQHRSLCPVPAFPTCLSGCFLPSGNCPGSAHPWRVPPHAYVYLQLCRFWNCLLT